MATTQNDNKNNACIVFMGILSAEKQERKRIETMTQEQMELAQKHV